MLHCDDVGGAVMLVGGPQRLLLTNLSHFDDQIRNLRDGSEAAIHEARVAIRRLREPLVLVRSDEEHGHVSALDKRLNKVFKALGRTRDADIAQRLVQHVESRFALAPVALGHLRAAISRTQLEARRDLIRALEATDADTLVAAVEAARHREWWRRFARDRWRAQLRAHIQGRAADVRQAVHHAGGVYFRNRCHAARVAIKQFRYALELANALGMRDDADDFRPLRKAQNALGEAHDRQILIDQLDELTGDDALVPKREAAVVQQFLEAEIAGFHQKYMLMRAEVLELCAACLRPSRRLPVRAGAVAVAAVAIGTVVRFRKQIPA
jgi:CHAD domain-containing protein